MAREGLGLDGGEGTPGTERGLSSQVVQQQGFGNATPRGQGGKLVMMLSNDSSNIPEQQGPGIPLSNASSLCQLFSLDFTNRNTAWLNSRSFFQCLPMAARLGSSKAATHSKPSPVFTCNKNKVPFRVDPMQRGCDLRVSATTLAAASSRPPSQRGWTPRRCVVINSGKASILLLFSTPEAATGLVMKASHRTATPWWQWRRLAKASCHLLLSLSHDFLSPGLQGDICSKFSARLRVESDQQRLRFPKGQRSNKFLATGW